MKKLKAPIRWVGSKRQLRDTIISMIPEHTCYVEPFMGAASVYFGKEPSTVEVINDRNNLLVNLFNVLQKEPHAFYDRLWFCLTSRITFREISLKLFGIESESILSDIDKAVFFYYHIQNAFGGKYGGTFGFSKLRPPSKMISYDTIINIKERLANTYIENADYGEVLRRYDGPSTFIYCDPPYTMTDKAGYYKFGFRSEDHVKLKDRLELLQGKWVLSYDNSETIRHLYKDFKIIETEPVTYSLRGKPQKKTELLISNF